MPKAIAITLNGSPRTIAAGSTIADLLVELAVNRTRVAVERNRAIVPKRTYDKVKLADSDHVEIVTFVGGG